MPGCAECRNLKAGVRMPRSVLACNSKVGWNMNQVQQRAGNPKKAGLGRYSSPTDFAEDNNSGGISRLV